MSAPRATMRLQFNAGFTFADARALLPYFAALGISHLYASPIMTARPGSKHGYDTIDPTLVNPELGGEEELRRLVDELRRHESAAHVGTGCHHLSEEGSWFTHPRLRHLLSPEPRPRIDALADDLSSAGAAPDWLPRRPRYVRSASPGF